MSIKNQRILNILMILSSWFSLLFVGKKDLKRYFLSSFLIVSFEAINAAYGKRKKWWVFYNKPKSLLFGELPFDYGPFFAISIWVLKWSKNNLFKFLSLNILINALFCFYFMGKLEKYKIAKLVKINEIQFFLYFFYKAFLFYGLQYLLENKINLFKHVKV